MTTMGDVRNMPMWFKLVLVLAGVILMLTGADLIPADASRFHTPHWVVFVAGLVFCTSGGISFLAQHRDTHPARYLFAVGVLMTCLCLVSVAVSIYVSGSVIAIGPILIKGPVADETSRFMFGVGALIMGILAFWVWRSWFRAMRSPNTPLQGGRVTSGPPAELKR